jgi:predicted HD phosphohydrolase
MKKFSEFLNEKLITFGGKRPKFNQIVIMAGGAGSGKGFVQKKLLGIDGKVLDVDAIKELLTGTKEKPELFAKKYGQKINKRMKNIFKSAISSPDRKPNIIFDVTMKDIKKLQDITDKVTELGYKKEDIHIVWVVNEIQTAIDQNAQRSRRVNSDILMKTHEGVSSTISNILKNQNIKNYIDGDFWFVFNKKAVDSLMVFGKNGGSFVDEAVYLKIKEKNKDMISYSDLADKFVRVVSKDADGKKQIDNINVMDKIKGYVPTAQHWENTNEGWFMADKGEPAKILDKFITTFWKQNKWHKHGVFIHTLGVVISAIRSGDFNMIPAAFLHDLGKPLLATRDDDKDELSYSFKGHEEGSYEVIKSWKFISKYTKELVRWHYLIRGKAKAKEKYEKTGDESYLKEYERQQKIWDSLDKKVQEDLKKFLRHDDRGKDITTLFKKYK